MTIQQQCHLPLMTRDPVHLDVVVPELNKRRLLFVIISKLTRLDDWRKGHKVGHHSASPRF